MIQRYIGACGPGAAPRLLMAMLVGVSGVATLPAEPVGTTAVTGFDSAGWNADDVRDSSGAGITNATTNAPGFGTTANEAGVQAQIDWRNAIGSLGNLGGVSLTGTATGSGKSTISVINPTTGLGAAGAALGTGFNAAYRWQNTDTTAAGISFKIGVQSTGWSASQAGFTATRSGEGSWDLLLVYDPSQPGNTPGNTTTNGAFVTSTVNATTSKFFLFGQAGNAYFPAPGGAAAKTLTEWAADPVWGPLLFGEGAKITNTQFGFGSGNAAASGVLDYASVSYLNAGARIDFVDAAGYTGPGGDFGEAGNWGGVTPGATQNLFVDRDATLTVTGSQQSRSVGVVAGTTGLVLNSGAMLVLNSAENGTLSVGTGATLGVSGQGALHAAVIEVGGTFNLATAATLDGGANPHPVRDGTSGTSRYGLVVLGGGEATLHAGAGVTVSQPGKVVGVRVGEGAGTGTLNLQAGSSLAVGTATDRGFFVVGDFGGTGVVNQTGGDLSVVGAVNIGSQGGTGTYTLSGGTLNVGLFEDGSDSNGVSVGARRTGANAAPTGTLNISGSGELILTRGYLLVGGDTSPTSGGTGVVNQTGGLVRIVKDGLALGSGASGTASGTYHLNGGVLELGGANGIQGGGSGGGAYAFNFGGGTLRVIERNLTTSITSKLVDGSVSLIDTNGLAADWSGAIEGARGGLVKVGTGTFTLGGDVNRSIGYLNADEGGLVHAAGTTTVTEFVVGSNYPAGGGAAEFTFSGGHIVLSGSIPDATTPSFRVGDFGGTGVFNQTGGTVTVGSASESAGLTIGNQGGAGTYNLSGGTLELAGGLNVIGRSAGSNPLSTGTLTISGASTVLELKNGSSLVIGNNFNRPAQGTGSVIQNGGTVRVTDGTIFVAGFGEGSYSLRGGTLEVGGNGLRARYNNTVSSSVFNFGGGTIKVIHSDLDTDVRAVLVDGTVSTVNTNGFNATFSQGMTGTGGLTKTGAGVLRFTGTGDYSGATLIAGGTFRVDGTLSQTMITVGAGATLAGHGTVANVNILDGGWVDLGDTTGVLTATGDFYLGDLSRLLLKIGSAADYDKITIGGGVQAGGTFEVVFVDGFNPSGEASFALLGAQSYGGEFGTLVLPDLTDGFAWDALALNSTGVLSIVATAIPEPASWAGLAGGIALALTVWRRRGGRPTNVIL